MNSSTAPQDAQDSVDNDCGIDILEHIERLKYPVIANAKSYIIRKVPPKRLRQVPCATYDMLFSRLDVIQQVSTYTPWFVLKYTMDADASVEALFQLLQRQLSSHQNLGICVARISNDVVCLIKKNDLKSVPVASLQLNGLLPTIYKLILTGHGPADAALRSVLNIYTDAANDCMSNMSMESNDNEYNIDELVRQCATLSNEQFQKLVADSKLTEKKKRSGFQHCILKVVPEMLKIRTVPSTSPMIITLADMKGKVQCFSEFRQDVLDLPMTIDDKTIAAHDGTLRQYIYDARVHQSLTLLLHGGTLISFCLVPVFFLV